MGWGRGEVTTEVQPVRPTDCGQPPTPAVGAIQPIGFVLILSSDWRISHASANIGDYFGAAPEAVIGQPVTSLFNPNAIHSLRNRLALLRGPDAVERLFSIALTDEPAHYDVAVHMSGDQVVIEAEKSRDRHHDRESTGTVRGMIAQLGEVGMLADFFEQAARQVCALTGYERVTIHRFGRDGMDEVVGEALRSGIGAAMRGHAAGSARSARQPAPRNLLSLVADIDASPVPIVPALDRCGRPLDLSWSVLRAGSPDELDLLRGIGVRASLSIAIVSGGRVWGRIACDHRAPCCPSFERRSAAEWYAIMLAMQIEIRELKALLGH